MGYFSCNGKSAIATCDPHYWDFKKKPKIRGDNINPRKSVSVKIREFFYADLVSATNGFSADNFLGKGSHGSVYKAVLDDGKLIAAVKKTKISNSSVNVTINGAGCVNCTHCTNSPAENEIEILSRVHNRRLVNLIGFCADTKLIVVEYMPNGSLYDLLHSNFRPPGWTRRVRFALQVAKAVQSLHSSDPPVIHRDIKSSNVLIDEKFNARLGDFGLALRGHVEDVRFKCTPPAGTLGYLDPGYLAPADLSTKSDVFSFGILLLEIISGRNPIDVNYSPPSVVDWAVPMIKHGDFAGICDRRVGSPVDMAAARHMAILAARCVRSTAEKRPAMSEVVECLNNVKKRVAVPPIWNSLRRRVERLEISQPLIKREIFEATEEGVKGVTKFGNRRNRKVSGVPASENENGATGLTSDRVVRSRSVGSVNSIKLGFDSNSKFVSLGRRKGGVAVKMGAVRLSKSRSMGVLQSPRLAQVLNHREIHLSKVVIALDERSEKIFLRQS